MKARFIECLFGAAAASGHYSLQSSSRGVPGGLVFLAVLGAVTAVLMIRSIF